MIFNHFTVQYRKNIEWMTEVSQDLTHYWWSPDQYWVAENQCNYFLKTVFPLTEAVLHSCVAGVSLTGLFVTLRAWPPGLCSHLSDQRLQHVLPTRPSLLRPTNDWKTSVGISLPMTVRQNAFQIWAERWWVSLPVISCHSLLFPAAQRPRGGGKKSLRQQSNAVRVVGVQAHVHGCVSASVRELLSWDDSVDLQIELSSCSRLLFISDALFFFTLGLESVVLNRGARLFGFHLSPSLHNSLVY